MDPWYGYGIQFVAAFQSLEWLEVPMRFFTLLGTQEFFMFALPAVYWCIDAGLGIQIGFMLLLSNGLNEFAKLILHEPRPYWISTQVKALAADSSFGAPSGHAQLATGIWGVLAAGIRRRWAWVVAAALIFLIGLSRLFLGVHFPQDALLGWLLGGLTLWAYLAWWRPVAVWVGKQGSGRQFILSLAASALLVLAGAIAVRARAEHEIPQVWIGYAARADGPLPAPVSMNPILTAAGTLLGFSSGLIWMKRLGSFHPQGPMWSRLVCFLVGLAGVLAVYLGLKAFFPEGDSLLAMGMRYVRYALLGIWVSAGAPWLFLRLGLTGKVQRPAPGGPPGRGGSL